MNLSPLPKQKFFSNDGEPLVGGLLYTYTAGTSTKVATYTDASGATPNTNPIVLDFRGEANIWLNNALSYKFILAPRGDTDPPSKPIWTIDNIKTSITLADLTQQIVGQIIWPQTALELAASATPTSYAYPPGFSLRYGGENSTSLNKAFSFLGGKYILDGNYLCTSKVQILTQINVEGESRHEVQIRSSGVTGYLMEIGNGVTNPQAGNLSNLRFYGEASNTGILHLTTNCHLWSLNNLLFSPSPCPALVVDDCWDASYGNIDILGCAGPGASASTNASVIIKGTSNNLTFERLRIENGVSGAIYCEGYITLMNGKADSGFLPQFAPSLTVTAAGNVQIDTYTFSGMNGQLTILCAGELRLASVLMDGGSGAQAHISDIRAWSHLDTVTFPGISSAAIGPVIPVIDLGRAHFKRVHPSVNTQTLAAITSRIYPLRQVANLTVNANGAVSGNTRTIGTTLTAASNDLYKGCYLVHNANGYLAAQRRKIITSFTSGNMVVYGDDALTLDGDYSIEYVGNHGTPIRTDGISIAAGMVEFQVISTGATISTAPAYDNTPGDPTYGLTTFSMAIPGVSAGTSLTGFHLIDEQTGYAYAIWYGLTAGGVVGVPYDESTRINTTHTFSVVAGYSNQVEVKGASASWMWARQIKTALLSDLNAEGFDLQNVPLWGFVPDQFTASLTGCTTVPTGVVGASTAGDIVTLHLPQITGTSNSTAATVTGLPALLRPLTSQPGLGVCYDNGTAVISAVRIETTGVITLLNGLSATFTNVGTKGIAEFVITYRLS